MALVIDIETVPGEKKFSSELEQKYLPQFKPKAKEQTDKQKLSEAYAKWEEDYVRKKSLDPDFGRICCIGLINFDEKNEEIIEEKTFIDQDEKKILTDFWAYIKNNNLYFRTITFNGISFDLPFLFKRSLYHGVPMVVSPVLKKYSYFPHFDIMQALSFWGGMAYNKSLQFYMEAFGFPMEKKDSTKIHEMWNKKEYVKISEYCLRDCRAELQIFLRIHKAFEGVR